MEIGLKNQVFHAHSHTKMLLTNEMFTLIYYQRTINLNNDEMLCFKTKD